MKNHIALERRIVSGRGHLRRKGWTLVITFVITMLLTFLWIILVGDRRQLDSSPFYDPVVSSFSWAASEKMNNHFRLRYGLINEYLQCDSTSCVSIDAYLLHMHWCIRMHWCIPTHALIFDTCACINAYGCIEVYTCIDAHLRIHWYLIHALLRTYTCIDACASIDACTHALMH